MPTPHEIARTRNAITGEIRVPNSTREYRSRPSWSVPNQWAEEGASNVWSGWVASGAEGASTRRQQGDHHDRERHQQADREEPVLAETPADRAEHALGIHGREDVGAVAHVSVILGSIQACTRSTTRLATT